MALQAVTEGRDGMFVPTANPAEAAVFEGLNVNPVDSLAEAVGSHPQVDTDPEEVDLDEGFRQLSHTEVHFVDVKGQDTAKRALLIAATGAPNDLLVGLPGTGKTLLTRRLLTIMPALTPGESLDPHLQRDGAALGRPDADDGPALQASPSLGQRRGTRGRRKPAPTR